MAGATRSNANCPATGITYVLVDSTGACHTRHARRHIEPRFTFAVVIRGRRTSGPEFVTVRFASSHPLAIKAQAEWTRYWPPEVLRTEIIEVTARVAANPPLAKRTSRRA